MPKIQKLARAASPVLIGLAVTAVTSNARAWDNKTYHASAECQPYGTDSESNDVFRDWNSVYPMDQDYLICPMAKDRFGSNTAFDVYVSVYDSSAGSDITCWSYCYYANGNAYSYDSDSTSGTPGNDTLEMLDAVGYTSADSTLVLFCRLPAKLYTNKIYGYRMRENNTSD
jgi:hypothetical protein